jgi:hypothetical protein
MHALCKIVRLPKLYELRVDRTSHKSFPVTRDAISAWASCVFPWPFMLEYPLTTNLKDEGHAAGMLTSVIIEPVSESGSGVTVKQLEESLPQVA